MLLNNKENRGTRETLGTEKQRHKRCHSASARPETKAPPPPPPPPPATNGLQLRVKGPEAELAAPPPVAAGRGPAFAIEPRDRFSFGEFAEEQELITLRQARLTLTQSELRPQPQPNPDCPT